MSAPAIDPDLEAVCACALADALLGDGEVLVTPIGDLPLLATRLAQLTTAPELMVGDGRGRLVRHLPDGTTVVEGALPFRTVFDVAWSGRRHVIMGAAQIDSHGNQNIAAIGDWRAPSAQLLGLRGAPGNAINHPVSYWIPAHSPRVFVEAVDVVCAPGYDRIAALGPGGRFFDLRRIVTDLAVLDFDTADRSMRVRSLHPGVAPEQVREATGFALVIRDGTPVTRRPTALERVVLDRLRA